MQIEHHIPRQPLSNFIQHMVYVSGSLSIDYIKELPVGGINLVVELNEHTKNTIHPYKPTESGIDIMHAWISGMQKQAILYKNNPDSTIISIRFTVGGFYALTKIPISSMDHVGIQAEAILGNSFKQLYQKLLNSPIVADKFALIETYFLQYAVVESMEQNIVKFVNQHLDRPIDWLIHKTGYSQKHVIHLLKKHTGFSPKYLQRIHRFHQVVNQIQRRKDQVDWLALVHRYGYHDQAHLINEFSHFSGIKPTEYLISQLLLENNNQVPDMILQLPDNKIKNQQ
jgi:AraC-like DNA-binding protein